MRRAKRLVEEISRGLTAPRRGEEIVDMADGKTGKIAFVNRSDRSIRAVIRKDTYRIPFKSIRWDTVRRRWVWWGLQEGDGDPRYDLAPQKWRVQFAWRGKTYAANVECPDGMSKDWAVNRFITSVLISFNVPRSKFGLEIYKIRQSGTLKVSDSSYKDPAGLELISA